MVDIIRTRRTFDPGVAPTALQEGQLAVNVPDKIIWIGDTGNLPVKIYDFSEGGGGVNDHFDLLNIGVNTHYEIDAIIDEFNAHVADFTNPHQVSLEQVGGAPAIHTHTLTDVTDSGEMAAVDDAPNDGQPYARKNLSWELTSDFAETDVIGGDGIIVERPGDGTVIIHSSDPQSVAARYLWNEAVSGDPGANYILGNQETTADITQLHISYTDADGVDRSEGLELIQADETLLFIHDPSSSLATFTTIGPVADMGTYGVLGVVFDAGDGTINPGTDDSITFQWFPSEGEEIVPPHMHDHTTDLTNVGTHTHDAIDNHIDDVTSNPHNVTFAQTNPPAEFPPAGHDHDGGVFP